MMGCRLEIDLNVRCLVRFVADALVLACEMKEDLGTEASLVPELGGNHRTSA